MLIWEVAAEYLGTGGLKRKRPYAEPGLSHNLNKAKLNSNGINNTIPNSLKIIHDLRCSRDLSHCSSSAVTSTACLLGSVMLLLFLESIPWNGISKTVGIPCYTWAALSPIASPELSLWMQALPHSSKQSSAILHNPFTTSKPVPPGLLLHYKVQLTAQGTTLNVSGI